MQSYQVRFVSDDALPEGTEYVFARVAEATYLFIRQSCINAETGRCDGLTRAWNAWQASEAEPPRPSRLRAEVGHIRVGTAVLLAGYGITAMKVGSAVF